MRDNGTKVMTICRIPVKGYWFSPVVEYELNSQEIHKERTKVY